MSRDVKLLQKFKDKATERHNGKYSYDLVVPCKQTESVNIICPIHGVFSQRKDVHVKGGGCQSCNKEDQSGPKYSTETYINKLLERYGDAHDYSKVVYAGSLSPVTIICRVHGEFVQSANHYKQYGKCPNCTLDRIRMSQEEFLERSFESHGDYYDYSLVNLTKGSTEKVDIICPVHGVIRQQAGPHASGDGCRNCSALVSARKRGVKVDEFVARAVTSHGDKYDYSKVTLEALVDTVTIVCPVHGDFQQVAQNHVSNTKPRGCIQCRNDATSYDMVKKYKNNKELGDSTGKIYLLEMYSEDERFLKIGITSDKYGRFKRYNQQRDLYDYEILIELEASNLETALLERHILRKFRENKYKPLNKFTGRSECINLECMDAVIHMMKEGST